MADIAVMGYGIVGAGVVGVLEKNSDIIRKNAGEEVNVKYVLDLRDFPDDPVQKKIIHDVDILLADDGVELVVETMGGVEPAFTFVKKALERGKHVCTSNKNLVAAKGAELLRIAKEKGVYFLFEAAVGGGIPIIRSLNNALTADKLESVTGILNGTCNYILTKMERDGESFEPALKKAQELGFAERDPENDIKGYDSCRKIAILASIISGKCVDYEKIITEGIDSVSHEDIEYAKKLGMKIKLLAKCSYDDGKLSAITAPFLIGNDHPLYGIDGVINAVSVHGNAVEDVAFTGPGAGRYPTASAVVSDIVDAIKHKGKDEYPLLWSEEELIPEDAGKTPYRYFVRIRENEKNDDSAFEAFRTLSLDSLDDEFAIITDEMTQQEFDERSKKVDTISFFRVI